MRRGVRGESPDRSGTFAETRRVRNTRVHRAPSQCDAPAVPDAASFLARRIRGPPRPLSVGRCPSSSKRLIKVRDDVFDVFDADGDADEPVGDAEAPALRGRDLAMGGTRGMRDAGEDVAEAREPDAEPQRVHEPERALLRVVLQLEGDESPAVRSPHRLRDRRLIRREARMMNLREPWVGSEPRGDPRRVLALTLHAQTERLDPA